jgi:hypothetical protein
MTLAAYLAWWRQHTQQQQQQPEAPGLAQESAAAAPAAPAGAPLWYCKDWHLASEFPQYHAYSCPPFFQDDWLNEWLDHRHQAQQQEKQQGHPQGQQRGQQQGQQRAEREASAAATASSSTTTGASPSSSSSSATVSDYRFVYLGPRGTSTPLHSDVLRSCSWSANVAGCKLWRLLPPQVRLLACLPRLGWPAALLLPLLIK